MAPASTACVIVGQSPQPCLFDTPRQDNSRPTRAGALGVERPTGTEPVLTPPACRPTRTSQSLRARTVHIDHMLFLRVCFQTADPCPLVGLGVSPVRMPLRR